MKNQAILNFHLCNRRREIESNEIKLERVEIEFEKHGPECRHVVVGEEVEFRIKLKNKSDVEFRNLEFRDPISRGLEFLENTFRVNGRHERAHFRHGEIHYRIPHLREHEEINITFCVRIREEDFEHERPGGGPGGPGQGGPGGPGGGPGGRPGLRTEE
ncbi:MAG: hypothetical protein FWE16_02205 [Firmicutes bacterium]|nr:hypothetical protein [Bacillota bacterium]